ncbi:MAG: PQQ-dependent sugar dehydrogenase [Gemmatimonadales bacterium]
MLLVIGACQSSPTNPPTVAVELQLVGNFTSPVFLTSPPNDSARLFIVEQAGRVRIVRRDTTLARAFLDLRGRINAGGEEGLLSIAFDPQYAINGRFYVYFTDDAGDIRVVRYNVSATDADSADETTADTVLAVAHPGQANHNGGQLQFGRDGMLFIGTGDGGGGGDPDNNGQNKHTLLGKLLRLDVNGASGYAIPADNPFATDTTGAPEVWSYGLRNPWRFSFDRQTGDLYIGDVGQGEWEEVDVATVGNQRGKGANYGWSIMEGNHCYPSGPCSTTGLVAPFAEYSHANGACTVVGGYVYRGDAIPELDGHYFYADYCNGVVTSFHFPDPVKIDWTSLLRPGNGVSSFGQDARGELYIMQLGGGVFRIIPTPTP